MSPRRRQEPPRAWSISPIPPRPEPNVREEVYQALRRAVLDIAASTSSPLHLRESELARSLGVSRTPVREALSRLQQELLVTVVPRRGVTVMPRSPAEYLAWLEVREVLEGLAARLAADRIDDATIATMRGLFSGFTPERLAVAGEDYAKANVAFHALVIEAAGNPVLKRLASQTYDHMQMVQLRVIDRLGRAQLSLDEHEAMIRAFEERDAARAERLAKAHIRGLRSAARKSLDTI